MFCREWVGYSSRFGGSEADSAFERWLRVGVLASANPIALIAGFDLLATAGIG